MTPIRAKLDEVMRPGRSYSRRPRARALGVEVIATRRSDAVVCALCRRLVEAGHDPATPMEVYRGQTLALHVRSIGEAAKLTVTEAGFGPRFTLWKPFKGPAELFHLASDADSDVDEGAEHPDSPQPLNATQNAPGDAPAGAAPGIPVQPTRTGG